MIVLKRIVGLFTQHGLNRNHPAIEMDSKMACGVYAAISRAEVHQEWQRAFDLLATAELTSGWLNGWALFFLFDKDGQRVGSTNKSHKKLQRKSNLGHGEVVYLVDTSSSEFDNSGCCFQSLYLFNWKTICFGMSRGVRCTEICYNAALAACEWLDFGLGIIQMVNAYRWYFRDRLKPPTRVGKNPSVTGCYIINSNRI